MKRAAYVLCGVLTTSYGLDCSTSAFQAILPSNATAAYTWTISQNSTFEVPAGDVAYPTSPTNLLAACAVQINVTSSPSSAFSFGLFLPDDWNERFLMVGNGGFAGGINWLDMGAGLGYGFAVASTDTGHNSTSGDATWATDQPEKKTDFGWRAMHGSTEMAKLVVEAFYGSSPRYSYYSGCSTGGRQGLKEVEMFPGDFDGVLAGAPAWWTTHLQTWTTWLGLANLPTTAAHHVPTALFPVVAKEVLRQCDPQDGLIDGIISDPFGCNVYLESLLCGPQAVNQTAAGCLTSAQIGTLYKLYNSYVETNDSFIFPGLTLGSEEQWEALLGSDEPSTLGYGYVQDFLLNDPQWNYWDYNYSIVELADSLDPGNATANDFDLSPFRNNGGKLLMYHGDSDGLIATGSSVYFHQQVTQTLIPKGIELDSWYRFFLVPGMQHCRGTPSDVDAPWYFAGANQAGSLGPGIHSVPGFHDAKHDILLALMDWVERGDAPDQIIATKWHNDTLQDAVYRQRPLCPYPKQARFKGCGSPDEASNWICEEPWVLSTQH